MIVIPAGYLMSDPTATSDTCEATLFVGRDHVGTLDSRFEGGAVNAVNVVTAMFTSTP